MPRVKQIASNENGDAGRRSVAFVFKHRPPAGTASPSFDSLPARRGPGFALRNAAGLVLSSNGNAASAP